MKRSLNLVFRLPALGCAGLLALHLSAGPRIVVLSAAALAVAGLRLAVLRSLVALALLGVSFISAVAVLVGVTTTTLIMGFDVILLLAVFTCAPALLTEPRFKGVRYFLLWWGVFLAAYSASAFMGESSDYSTFAWQYFAVYGSFYALTGILAVVSEAPLRDLLAPGLLMFAFQYWLLDASILSVSKIADFQIGLRGNKEFDPIYGARTAGLLILMAISVFLVERKRWRWLPDIVLALTLGAPLAWYAYTRQVYVAIVLVALCMVLVLVFGRRKPAEEDGGRVIPLAALCFGALGVGVEVVHLLTGVARSSRLVQGGLELNRTSVWKICLGLIAQHPVTGIGVGGFQKTGIGLWPHNWIIESWLALGLLGFVLTVMAGGAILWALLRQRAPWFRGWDYLGLYYLILVQVSGDIARNSPLLFFVVLAFHAIAQKESNAADRLAQPASTADTSRAASEVLGW